ncbi:DUF1592 domain-containing protein [Roseibacillus ishigakijimensis]|uniref:DUF1592 domain-containing protein n=1 Tax=Roseibacillus ishigakijimensis TaxID=454146 RepID=A0A934RP22_9BACT|nr:DUF1592 domain-containing protein [Roseibacillus ishigakijimensis]MBK1834353.1 DUF1592 domain-containing protein [Roseibacillus ishigakijimensis]
MRRLQLLAPLLTLPLSLAAQPLPDEVEDLLDFYCYDCHGYGKKEGGIKLDDLTLGADKHRDLWESMWRNVRTGMMPPADGEQFLPEERKELLDWLERNPLGIDRENPDPGRVTVRRHNRVEYQATVKDLLALDFSTAEHFPPDDTGYGFDTIGDVLSISPLLAERYFEAAQLLMDEAVPDNAAKLPTTEIHAPGFVAPDDKAQTGRFIEFTIPQTVTAKRWTAEEGEHEIVLAFDVAGSAEATDNTATLVLAVNGKELARKELGWDFQKTLTLRAKTHLPAAEHEYSLQILAGEPPKEGQDELGVEVQQLRIIGPLGAENRQYPESYRRVIARDHQPRTRDEWPQKIRAVLGDFAAKAWRRPVENETLDRLTEISWQEAERRNSFEAGIRLGGTAILASPRFVLRTELAEDEVPADGYPLIDEWSLASRLSYFLWSSLPDEELREHAAAGTLRANLATQVERMLQDRKANRFVRHFVGQWLQARDVESLGMRPERILRISFNEGQRTFNPTLRRNMREETEALFRHVLQEKRPAVELIDANYTFLNKRLADFYGIRGVDHEDLKKVDVPDNRGGLLTQGTFLVVTSNPTRTSPVKRGLFVLDNLLGTPPPPAPPEVPELEEPRRGHKNPTMREQMEIHRANPDCRSCHQRMDPIGLAFENFTAVGTYREQDGGQDIVTDGELVTGEKFAGVKELKRILATDKRGDFHRCLAEKLLTYALGRGVEYYDAPAVDEIVTRMEEKGGTLHEAVLAVIDSVPFQKRRAD